jgi:two-component system response regulator MprA
MAGTAREAWVSRRVLFVDDEEMNRTLLTTQLQTNGYEVVACANGDAAFSALAAGPPFDIIILDVMMPPPDGIEICRRIRTKGINLPILFMSGWPDVETQARALAAGGSAFLPRPYRREQLIATINALLGRKAG